VAKYKTSRATSTFLAKIAKGEDDGAEEMALLAHSEREEEVFVSSIQVRPLTDR
jgi:hypothetical protein